MQNITFMENDYWCSARCNTDYLVENYWYSARCNT